MLLAIIFVYSIFLSFRPKWDNKTDTPGSEWMTGWNSKEQQGYRGASLLKMSNSIKADFVWWTIVYVCFFFSLKRESEIAGFYQSLAAYQAIYLDDKLPFSLTCCLHRSKVVWTLDDNFSVRYSTVFLSFSQAFFTC